MKQTLKATAAIIGIVAACWLALEILIAFMWACYYAGKRQYFYCINKRIQTRGIQPYGG